MSIYHLSKRKDETFISKNKIRLDFEIINYYLVQTITKIPIDCLDFGQLFTKTSHCATGLSGQLVVCTEYLLSGILFAVKFGNGVTE